MKRVGRNDPCPCGSGKKYKKCCEQEQKVIQLFSGEITQKEALEVRAMFESFSEDLKQGFWRELCDAMAAENVDGPIAEDFENLAFEWFSIDMPIDGKNSLFDLFLEEVGSKMDRPLIKKLDTWKETRISVYRVLDSSKSENRILKDLFTGEEKEVSYRGYDHQVNEDELQVGRLVPVEGIYEPFMGSFSFDSALEEDFVELLTLEKNRENTPWESFLKEKGEHLVFLLLAMFSEEMDEDEEMSPWMIHFSIRRFLMEPRMTLKGKSALEAIYTPGMNKPLKKFMNEIEKGKYDDPQKYPIPFSFYRREVEEILSFRYKDVTKTTALEWEKDLYQKEAELFLEKAKGLYFPEDLERSLTVWHNFANERMPGFRKPGAWASVLEVLTSMSVMNDQQPTQKEVAEKYQVSVSTLSSNLSTLDDYVFSDGQGSDPREAPEVLRGKPGGGSPIPEREMAKITKLLEKQDFDSPEEAQDFLNQLIGKNLDDLEDGEGLPGGQSKEEEAQALVYEAWDAHSIKEKVRLAKKALAIDPNTEDAYGILGQYHAKGVDQKIDYFRKGLKAGENKLGEAYFRENQGNFWGLVETRPYMRLKMDLAMVLMRKKEYEQAAKEMERMLKLNPNDNQRVRSILTVCYFLMKEYGKVKDLLDRYEEDYSCEWAYNLALYTFARKGETRRTNLLLEKAMKKNPHVISYLTGTEEMPEDPPAYYSFGEKEEASTYVFDAMEAWSETPGALEWAKSHRKPTGKD